MHIYIYICTYIYIYIACNEIYYRYINSITWWNAPQRFFIACIIQLYIIVSTYIYNCFVYDRNYHYIYYIFYCIYNIYCISYLATCSTYILYCIVLISRLNIVNMSNDGDYLFHNVHAIRNTCSTHPRCRNSLSRKKNIRRCKHELSPSLLSLCKKKKTISIWLTNNFLLTLHLISNRHYEKKNSINKMQLHISSGNPLSQHDWATEEQNHTRHLIKWHTRTMETLKLW